MKFERCLWIRQYCIDIYFLILISVLWLNTRVSLFLGYIF